MWTGELPQSGSDVCSFGTAKVGVNATAEALSLNSFAFGFNAFLEVAIGVSPFVCLVVVDEDEDDDMLWVLFPDLLSILCSCPLVASFFFGADFVEVVFELLPFARADVSAICEEAASFISSVWP